MKITGFVDFVGPVEQVSEKFRKRDLILNVPTNNPQYQNFVKFQATQNKVALLDGLYPGAQVSVEFFINGNKVNTQKGMQVFINLTINTVEIVGGQQPLQQWGQPQQQWNQPQQQWGQPQQQWNQPAPPQPAPQPQPQQPTQQWGTPQPSAPQANQWGGQQVPQQQAPAPATQTPPAPPQNAQQYGGGSQQPNPNPTPPTTQAPNQGTEGFSLGGNTQYDDLPF